MGRRAFIVLAVLGACDQAPPTPPPVGPQPFIDAVTAGDVRAVTDFVGSGANPNSPNGKGVTPFIAAINRLHVPNKHASPSFAIETEPDPAREAADRKERRDRLLIAMLLVQHGGDVGATCINGDHPLMVALGNWQPEIAEELILRGADVNDIYKEYPEKKTALHMAIEWSDITALMLSKGAKVDAKDASEQTPLFQAAINGYESTVFVLIRAGADVNASGRNGTALEAIRDQAFRSRGSDPDPRAVNIIKMLETTGAKPQQRR